MQPIRNLKGADTDAAVSGVGAAWALGAAADTRVLHGDNDIFTVGKSADGQSAPPEASLLQR